MADSGKGMDRCRFCILAPCDSLQYVSSAMLMLRASKFMTTCTWKSSRMASLFAPERLGDVSTKHPEQMILPIAISVGNHHEATGI